MNFISLSRNFEPPGNLLVRLGSPRKQPLAQIRETIRNQKISTASGIADCTASAPLTSGFMMTSYPSVKLLLDVIPWRPVKVAVILARLQKTPCEAKPLELFLRNEEVVFFVAFLGPARRVVAEPNTASSPPWRKASTKVSLPAPDGPDTTNSRPGPLVNPPSVHAPWRQALEIAGSRGGDA